MRLSARASRTLLIAAALLCGAGAAVVQAAGDSDIGVIVMADGGTRAWTKIVTKAVKDAGLPYPTRVFFGAGDSVVQQGILQDYVRDLEDNGAHTLIAIPLAVSPYAQSYKQWRYLLGVDIQPGYNNAPLFPIEKHSSIRFAEPFNDSAMVVEILLDRIQEISRDPSEESVVIVTRGPRDTGDNTQWLQVLARVCGRIKDRGHYRSVEAVTLREDAPSDERQQSMIKFRHTVDAIQQTGARALVVPLLLDAGGIEHKISLELRGIAYSYNNKTLLPDSRISDWIRSQLP